MYEVGGVVAVIALVGAVYYAKKGVAAAVDTAKVALDPVNPNNIVNSTVTHFGAGITGDAGWTLGGAIYDWTHPAATPVPTSITPATKNAAIRKVAA